MHTKIIQENICPFVLYAKEKITLASDQNDTVHKFLND